jgi:ribosome-associated protein
MPGASDEFTTPDGIELDPSSITWKAVRSGGPGGQHANTSDTAITMTVDLRAANIDDEVLERIVAKLGPTVTVVASDTRSQWQNRQIAWLRLAERIDEAAVRVRRRHPTRPSRSAVGERLESKKKRSQVKRERQRPAGDD